MRVFFKLLFCCALLLCATESRSQVVIAPEENLAKWLSLDSVQYIPVIDLSSEDHPGKSLIRYQDKYYLASDLRRFMSILNIKEQYDMFALIEEAIIDEYRKRIDPAFRKIQTVIILKKTKPSAQ